MKVPRKVPGEIQSQVRGQVHADAEIISASKLNRKKRKASLGRYLGRSGNSYVFQMRLPKKVLGDRPNMLRLTLGPMAYLEASRLADELAGLFEELAEFAEKLAHAPSMAASFRIPGPVVEMAMARCSDVVRPFLRQP